MSVFTGFFAKCDRRDQEGVSVLTEIVAIFSILATVCIGLGNVRGNCAFVVVGPEASALGVRSF